MAPSSEAAEREEHLIAFRLDEETYAVDIGLVHEIVRMCSITPVPRALGDIEGVINLRGRIVPVVDLRRRLGLRTAERCTATRIMIVEIDGMTVGAIVDSVTGVIRIADGDIELPGALVGAASAHYVRGIGKRGDELVILLNLNSALSVAEAA